MKKLLFALIIGASLTTVSAHAQMPKGSPAEMKQMLKDSLGLTDVQIDSVTAIRQQITSQIRTINQDQTLTQDQKKEKMQPLREEMKMRLKANLSKEQVQKLQQMQHGMRGGNKMDNNQ